MTDALELHLAATRRIDWRQLPSDLARRLAALQPAPAACARADAHEEFIAKQDGRDSGRAARMLAALAVLQEWARQRRSVCWAGLQDVQRIVLGKESGFRTGIAWAKGGQERYGLWPDLESEFADKIASDDTDGAHPVAAAVRLYLDVCFFHPFRDGNARAARLWFGYVLRRGGYRLGFAEPLFLVERWAGDPADYLDFLRLAVLSCERGR
jgi:hypothetical protein